jgi:hypothetical protein
MIQLEKELSWLESLLFVRWCDAAVDFRTASGAAYEQHVHHLKPSHINLTVPETNFEDPELSELFAQMSYEERVLLAMLLAYHLYPGFIDYQLDRYFNVLDRASGLFNQSHRDSYMSLLFRSSLVRGQHAYCFMPTGTLYLTIMAGRNTSLRKELIQKIYTNEMVLFKQNIMRPLPALNGEPLLSNILTIDMPFIYRLITDQKFQPEPIQA